MIVRIKSKRDGYRAGVSHPRLATDHGRALYRKHAGKAQADPVLTVELIDGELPNQLRFRHRKVLAKWRLQAWAADSNQEGAKRPQPSL
ncbi:hypothetical protein [Ectopseudomonas oleovorans]|uniref:hypothetical protein n=1 Tax=Ectopseudomonas oleovorans TaxID=301 RepID=UPI003F19BF8F